MSLHTTFEKRWLLVMRSLHCVKHKKTTILIASGKMKICYSFFSMSRALQIINTYLTFKPYLLAEFSVMTGRISGVQFFDNR